MDKYIFEGKTAIVTGGTSGIGLATARNLAEKGSNIAIIGRNEVALQEIHDELSAKYPNQKITSHRLDLSDIPSIPNTIKEIAKSHNNIGLLVNNAGIAMAGKFNELSLDDMETVFTINFRSQVAMVKEVMPYLQKTKGSHIANVSSIFGIIAPSGQSAYSASKFAVRGFSEVLRQELKTEGIGVSTIFPGGVKTNIAKNAKVGKFVNPKGVKSGIKKFEANLTMTPEYAAEIIVNGIEKRKPRIIIGGLTKFLDIMTRILPAKYDFLLKSIK